MASGYDGIIGNEFADMLAYKVSTAKLIGSEPYCGISKTAEYLNFEHEYINRERTDTGSLTKEQIVLHDNLVRKVLKFI